MIGLDLIKIVPYFDDILQRPIIKSNLIEYNDLTITKLMATCHNISTINDKFIGDPLESFVKQIKKISNF